MIFKKQNSQKTKEFTEKDFSEEYKSKKYLLNDDFTEKDFSENDIEKNVSKSKNVSRSKSKNEDFSESDDIAKSIDEIKRCNQMYENSPINFVNKNTSPNFLFCYNCNKTTNVIKTGSFILNIKKLLNKVKGVKLTTTGSSSNNKNDINKNEFKEIKEVNYDLNTLFKCKECLNYYNIKLYKARDDDFYKKSQSKNSFSLLNFSKNFSNSSLTDKKIIIESKLSLIGTKTKEKCVKAFSSAKKTSSKLIKGISKKLS